MSKHTPGPWIYEADIGTHIIRGADVERNDNGVKFNFRDYVASTWGGENESNARLIAAAPELFQVCVEMLELSENWPGIAHSEDLKKRASAAIAKAIGEQP